MCNCFGLKKKLKKKKILSLAVSSFLISIKVKTCALVDGMLVGPSSSMVHGVTACEPPLSLSPIAFDSEVLSLRAT